MRIAVMVLGLIFGGGSVAHATPVKTFFDYADVAWGVGTIQFSKPLEYRDGKLLVYPTYLSGWIDGQPDKKSTLMVVRELRGDVETWKEGDKMFAFVRWLPTNSYWRDNLPKGPRHDREAACDCRHDRGGS